MEKIGDWSASLNSSYVRDETLTFESEILKQAHEEWVRQGAGSIPARSVFTPRIAKAFLGNLVIFERQASTFLIRLMGTRITAVLGEMQGRSVDEALPGDVAARWGDALGTVLTSLRPVRIVKTVTFNDLQYLEAEILLAPLLDAQGQATLVFTVAVFRSGVAPSRRLGDIIGGAS